jgi:hypothetical protein
MLGGCHVAALGAGRVSARADRRARPGWPFTRFHSFPVSGGVWFSSPGTASAEARCSAPASRAAAAQAGQHPGLRGVHAPPLLIRKHQGAGRANAHGGGERLQSDPSSGGSRRVPNGRAPRGGIVCSSRNATA